MLTKLLFTALVVAVVYGVYRIRSRGPAAPPAPAQRPADRRLGQRAAYAFVAVLVLISGTLYYFHWREQHRVVTIRVIDGRTGEQTVYRAYQKSISGDRFEALDGTVVRLGADERVEMTGLN